MPSTIEIGRNALTAGVYINHLRPGVSRLVVIGLEGETLCEVTGTDRFLDILLDMGGAERLTQAIDVYTLGVDRPLEEGEGGAKDRPPPLGLAPRAD